MKRRKFLWLSMAGTAAMGLPSLQCREPSAAVEKILSEPLMLSRFCDEASLKKIGMGYRERFGAGDQSNLRQNLLQGVSGTEGNELRESILDRIREDFDQGRIVRIDGWIISETEARQCALLSFNQRSH